MPTLLSLFSGAGGLDLGLERAGFDIVGCLERDVIARNTLKLNRPSWPQLGSGDVFEQAPLEVRRSVGLRRRQLAVLSAGPPCQPFSKAALWVQGSPFRFRDARARTIHRLFDYVVEFLPRFVLLENVVAMRSHSSDGLRFIKDNFRRVNRRHGTDYKPFFFFLDSSEYGVPQRRQRLIIIAERSGREISKPLPTHSATPVAKLAPITTAWDAIGHLDSSSLSTDLWPTGRWAGLLPSIPEGENYLWHTPRGAGVPIFGWRTRYWTFLLKLAKNRPSWTLSATPGPATGPFHWRNRRLSAEEMCLLQTFPASFAVQGSLRDAYRQIGNAVPPALGQAIGSHLMTTAFGQPAADDWSLVPQKRLDCPPPEVTRPVSREYLLLSGKPAAHLGTGKGPRATALWADRYE